MAIKKTQLYSILWESCNVLRGSMDASQYKNYVLTMLFLKYISDKVKADSGLYFVLPEGCSFDDIVDLKSQPDIGEKITKILHRIAQANPQLDRIINAADFDDSSMLGTGKAKVDTISNLIAVFQNKILDFSRNRVGDDDLIGDAYEYLMKNFAAESGKKKGQFYTPAEVSRLMAQIIGISRDRRPRISIYDPTCGSGSLLLRARAEAHEGTGVDIFGQEKEGATRGMAVMNMFLHGVDDSEIAVGDTIEKPGFKDGPNSIQTFDYVVANPPFSIKGWIKGEVKEEDKYGRWGSSDKLPPIPPSGYEDYAFLLHIIKSLKSRGHAACILPNGVLFRGNEEENVRRKLIERRYIRGIISLPPNLFFGTGIPACIIIIDKGRTATAKGIFMIDARSGFAKDGAKNRLREQDIRRVYDAWQLMEVREDDGTLDGTEIIPHYARFVPYDEITNERNDCNLNVSRYITPVDTEIKQDIFAHLRLNGGLPSYDVDEGLAYVWRHCPSLKGELFAPMQTGYYHLAVDKKDIGQTIAANREFLALNDFFSDAIDSWYQLVAQSMFDLDVDCKPKELIADWSESLLEAATEANSLVAPYDIYEIIMRYWSATMQDDCYLISRDGWQVEIKAEELKVDKKDKGKVATVLKKNPTFRDYVCDLLPVDIVIGRYFPDEYKAVLSAEGEVEQIDGEITQLEEEYSEELNDTLSAISFKYRCAICRPPIEGEIEVLEKYLAVKGNSKEAKRQRAELVAAHAAVFASLDNTNANTVKSRLFDVKSYAPLPQETIDLYRQYIVLNTSLTDAKRKAKTAVTHLTELIVKKYPTLTVDEIKDMVINDKWHTAIVGGANDEAMRVRLAIEEQVATLVARYERRLSDISDSVTDLENRVKSHLAKMGFEL